MRFPVVVASPDPLGDEVVPPSPQKDREDTAITPEAEEGRGPGGRERRPRVDGWSQKFPHYLNPPRALQIADRASGDSFVHASTALIDPQADCGT